jgi:hypothetical protein
VKIRFSGGLNEQQQPSLMEAAKGSYNFDLSKDRNALIPRAPFDLKGTATNNGDVRGIMQLVKRDDSETTLIQAGGTVYSWDGASTFTNVGSCTSSSQLRGCYWSLDDYLVVTDLQKNTVVSKWNGTTFGTQTTGLGVDLYAKYAIVHNGRVWLFNVTAGSDTPHLMVASAYENPTSFSTTQRAVTGTFTTGLEAFYILTPDLRPINGVAKTLAGDLIISTVDGALFKLTGSSATTYAFTEFYPRSNAIGNESMVSMGNDIVYMRKHGSIDLLGATQNYGDVAADDLSRWIPESVAGLSESITVYDQYNQKALFFVDGKVLVLFKDILYGGALVGDSGERAKLSPWTVYKTQESSGFNTNAAAYIRIPGTTEYTVYFGDESGRVFDLNGTGVSGDAGTADITVVRKTRYISEEDQANFMNGINKGTLRYRRESNVSFNVKMDWADEFSESEATVSLKADPANNVSYYGGSAYYGGAFYYNGSAPLREKISHVNFSFVGRGPGAVMTCSSTDTLPYQVEMIELK